MILLHYYNIDIKCIIINLFVIFGKIHGNVFDSKHYNTENFEFVDHLIVLLVIKK